MFTKAVKAKFEWQGLPDGLTSIYVEDLIMSRENFAAVVFDRAGIPEESRGEWWGDFAVTEFSQKYGTPKNIFCVQYLGTSQIFKRGEYVLFDEFCGRYDCPPTMTRTYIKAYSVMLAEINKAIRQHVKAQTLIATVYAQTAEEYNELKKVFEGFDGVKLVKSDSDAAFDGKKVNFVQFNVDARYTELAELKQRMQDDCFLRLGIRTGIDKTHITNYNVEDTEEVCDLINAYELKRREDFCRRYNAWGRGENALSVKIHAVAAQEGGNDRNPDDDENGAQSANLGAEGENYDDE